MEELTFVCANATSTYRTLIEMHMCKVKYRVTSKFDENGKIIFYVTCKVKAEKVKEVEQTVYAHVHA